MNGSRWWVLDLRRLTTLEGRILVHGEEDTGRQAGRSYLMLEGTDGQVHYVYYTPEMEGARGRGGLRTNSFVRLRKLFADGHPVLKIDELGDSEAILRNKRYLRETVHRSATGRLEWMARALPEGASGGCGDCRTPTPHEGSGAP